MRAPLISLHSSVRRGAVLRCSLKRVWPSVGPAGTSLGSARLFLGKPRPNALRALDADKAGADLPALSFAELAEHIRFQLSEAFGANLHAYFSEFYSATSLQDWSAVVSEKGEGNFS